MPFKKVVGDVTVIADASVVKIDRQSRDSNDRAHAITLTTEQAQDLAYALKCLHCVQDEK